MGGTANVVPPAFCRKTYITYKNGVWGVAPRQVAGTPVPVFTPGTDAGRVCQKALCKDAYKWSNKVGAGRTDNKRPRLHRCKANQAYTAFHGGKGAVRHGCRNKDTPSFKHGCLQVVEQSRCRTHRQQTTTVAQKQSQQSVLKGIGIENKHFF